MPVVYGEEREINVVFGAVYVESAGAHGISLSVHQMLDSISATLSPDEMVELIVALTEMLPEGTTLPGDEETRLTPDEHRILAATIVNAELTREDFEFSATVAGVETDHVYSLIPKLGLHFSPSSGTVVPHDSPL